MKNIFKSAITLIIAIVIASTSITAFAKDKNAEHFKQYKTIVEDMYKKMVALPESENVDMDYVNEMMALDESAVNISKNYIKYNKWTKEIRVIAENIIENQEENTKHMESIIKEIRNKNENNPTQEIPYLLEYNTILSKMYNNLINLKSTGKIDRDYLQTLIIQHQGAIDISDLILKYTNNKNIKKMAEDKKESLNKEITKMDMILQKTKDFKMHDLK